MRTTLTLDDDVAAAIQRRQSARGDSFKQEVNDLLRAGIVHLEQQAAPRAAIALKPLAIGKPLLGSFDDIAEVLALSEGDVHR